jgi:hypothetical protein
MMDYKAEIERTKAVFGRREARHAHEWLEQPMAGLQRAFKVRILVCAQRQDSLKGKHRNVTRNHRRYGEEKRR